MCKRYKRLLALLLALLLTACGAQDGELPPSSGEEAVPLSLTVSLPQLPDTLDPAASQGQHPPFPAVPGQQQVQPI